MFIRRCGWHRRYHGHGKLLGITSWASWTVTFSDGMCERCAVRAREEWGLPSAPAEISDARHHKARWPAFPFATAALAATIAVVIVGLVTRNPDHAAFVTGTTGVDQGTTDGHAIPSAPSSGVIARGWEQVTPETLTSQHAEITGDGLRVTPAKPVARRVRLVRAGHRGASVPISSDPLPEIAPDSEVPLVYYVAAAIPYVAAAIPTPQTPAASAIEARTLHPFSAPGIVENQAP